MTKRDIIVAVGTFLAMSLVGSSAIYQTQVASQTVTTGPPVVLNGQLTATAVTTIIPGTGSGYLAYTLTNEDILQGMRCMYGTITGGPPASAPSSTAGSLIAAGVSLTERTAPSNRLDCIAVAGTVNYDITLYPK